MLHPDGLPANASARQADSSQRLGKAIRRSVYVRAKPCDNAKRFLSNRYFPSRRWIAARHVISPIVPRGELHLNRNSARLAATDGQGKS